MACGGMIFIEKLSNFRKVFHFFLFHSILLCCLCYYCSINVKEQSEFSGLSPDTGSLVAIWSEQSKILSKIVPKY